MMTGSEDDATKVWVLTDDRPGNRTQAIGAARALGIPFVEKRLAFNERQKTATPRLGATLETLDGPSRATVAPPYPDLLIAAGRRTVPVAHWIKRESGGGARVVLIGRKTPDGVADLTVRAAYLQQAPHPKLLELVLPPTQVDAQTLARVRAEEPDPLADRPRPRVVFLFGGPTGQHEMRKSPAKRMAREVAAATAALGGSLDILTSRRTPQDVFVAVKRVAQAARVHKWSSDAAYNPYLAFLANADLLVVTGESESMISEAVAANKPLTVYPLPTKKPTIKSRVRGAIANAAEGSGPLAPLCRKIMSDGWVTPRRDLSVLHRLIEERGWGKLFDGALNRQPPSPTGERDRLRERIAELVARRGAPA